MTKIPLSQYPRIVFYINSFANKTNLKHENDNLRKAYKFLGWALGTL